MCRSKRRANERWAAIAATMPKKHVSSIITDDPHAARVVVAQRENERESYRKAIFGETPPGESRKGGRRHT